MSDTFPKQIYVYIDDKDKIVASESLLDMANGDVPMRVVGCYKLTARATAKFCGVQVSYDLPLEPPQLMSNMELSRNVDPARPTESY